MTTFLTLLLCGATLALLVLAFGVLQLVHVVGQLRGDMQSERGWADKYFAEWQQAESELNILRAKLESQ